MIRLWLARHAQTEWNVEGRMQGHRDSPLTDLGRRQAEALGRALEAVPLCSAVTSPAERALATARVALARRPGVPLIVEEALREIRLGPWEGLTKDEIARRWPREFDLFWHHPAEFCRVEQGEDYGDLYARVRGWWDDFRPRLTDGDWLLVSHGITLQVLLLLLGGRELRDLHRERILQQCALTLVELEPEGPRVVFQNRTDHLDGVRV